MRRALAVLAILAAAPAARAGEGVYLTIDGGYGFWSKEALKTSLPPQVGAANTDLLLDVQMPDGAMVGLRLGFNVGGHAAFEGHMTVHPWDVLAQTRGGTLFTGLAARWFPLQGLIRPNRQADFSVFAGMNYVIQGGNGQKDPNSSGTIPNTGRGYDGIAYEFGGTFELYPAKSVSIGLTPRYYKLHMLRYFTDFNHRNEGGQIPVTGPSAGSMFAINLSVTFHFEPIPD